MLDLLLNEEIYKNMQLNYKKSCLFQSVKNNVIKIKYIYTKLFQIRYLYYKVNYTYIIITSLIVHVLIILK